MERAATQCVEWISARFTKDNLFVVLCGSGNNGGDGLAIARMLHYSGYGVKAFMLQLGELSADCNANMQRLQKMDGYLLDIMQPDTFITDIPGNIVIIDAILGTGLNRPVQGWVADFIRQINRLPNRKIAIDVPSGLPADSVPDGDAAIVKANDTLSFQFSKRSFYHPETGIYSGVVHILDIGLDKTYIEATHTHYYTIDRSTVAEIYRPRNPFGHKGDYGHALIIGGSYGKIGAIILSTKAALRAGAGLVTGLVPQCGYDAIQSAAPEVMCRTNGERQIEKITEWDKADAIGIGPGLSTSNGAARAFAEFIEACKQPIVADADAINLLAKQNELLTKIPANSIITPHPKEFSRLFGESNNSMTQLEQARTHAMKYNIFIVLKGHYTQVVTPEGDCWYNTTGNAGMATAGAGDVLTGIITGLLAQQYSPSEAALLGVYLHGLAGDFAAGKNSQEAMIAGDIIKNLGKAFQFIRS
jgi:NAD(P)H-hydrate epimerase